MAGNQQYQAQLEALKELDFHLQRVINETQNIMRGYAAKIAELQDRGLPMEVHDTMMAEFYMQSQNLTTQSCAAIEQAIQYVRRHIQGLEQLMR
jgi:hypothetical protein